MIGSVFCFSIVNSCAKWLDSIPVHELVFFRSLVSFALGYYFIRRLRLSVFGNNKFWLLMRGITGLIALMLFFATIKHMPLASASTVQYLSPFFTVLLAISMNKQPVHRMQWLFFLLAFIGVIMIKGVDDRVPVMWLLVGIVSAVFAGLAYNSIIKSKGTDHPLIIVSYFPMVSLPVTGMWCMMDWVNPVGWQWIALLVMGVFTQAAQYLMTLALHSADASRIAPWNNVGAVFAILFGFFFFGEAIHWLSLAGIAVVVTAVTLNARYKHRIQSSAFR